MLFKILLYLSLFPLLLLPSHSYTKFGNSKFSSYNHLVADQIFFFSRFVSISYDCAFDIITVMSISLNFAIKPINQILTVEITVSEVDANLSRIAKYFSV